MDKQQYHLISYHIILINFPHSPHKPLKNLKNAEVKSPKCQWIIHTSTRFRNVLSSYVGRNLPGKWHNLSDYSTAGTLERTNPYHPQVFWPAREKIEEMSL